MFRKQLKLNNRKKSFKKETEELKNHVKAKMLKEVTELAQKMTLHF